MNKKLDIPTAFGMFFWFVTIFIIAFPYSIGLCFLLTAGTALICFRVEDAWHTELTFHYKTPSGAVVSEKIVLSGRISRIQKKTILDCIGDNRMFMPSLLALPFMDEALYEEAGYPACWMNTSDIRVRLGSALKEDGMYISRSIADLVTDFQWAKGHWDEAEELRQLQWKYIKVGFPNLEPEEQKRLSSLLWRGRPQAK